jgi:hypothetical protein
MGGLNQDSILAIRLEFGLSSAKGPKIPAHLHISTLIWENIIMPLFEVSNLFIQLSILCHILLRLTINL